MIYLLIPIACFVVIGGFYWLIWSSIVGERVWKRKIDDLDLVLSVLATAGWGNPTLILKVPRRMTSLKMTFPGSTIRLEMPLVTRLQRSREDRYLDFLRGLNLNPRIVRNDADPDTLIWHVEESPTEAAALIGDALLTLFEIDADRELEYRVDAYSSDQQVLIRALDDPCPKTLPEAATRGMDPNDERNEHAGCLNILVALFLLPIPFVIAYLEFGIIAACYVLVAIFLVRDTYRRFKWSKGDTGFPLCWRVSTLLLATATIVYDDPLYLQLIPTTALSAFAVIAILSIVFDRWTLLSFKPDSDTGPKANRLLVHAVIATCIGGVVLNEYLRRTITLDDWVWFFAFFRIELILGTLVTSTPLIIYMVRNMPENDEDADAQ